MTENQIQELFVKNNFATAKQLLIKSIEQMGMKVTGNEHVFELKAMALSGGANQVIGNESTGEVVEGSGESERNGSSTEPEKSERQMKEIQNQTGEEIGEGIEEEQNEGEEYAGKKISEFESTGLNEFEEGQEIGKPQPPQTIKQPSEETQQQGEERQSEGNEKPARRARSPRKSKQMSPEEMIAQKNAENAEKQKEVDKMLEEIRRNQEEVERIRKEEEERRRIEQEKSQSSKHRQTDEVVRRIKCLGKAFLVGPAGTGKSTIAMQACAQIFGMETVQEVLRSDKFAQISFSPDTVSADMIGFTDVNGVFHETDIIRVFRDGGVILFDEMDDADASLLVKLNTMLANGVIPTPGGIITQNPNTYIVGTANTFGKGGNSMYVGRSRLDAATLDRWKLSTIQIDYDSDMESKMILASGVSKDSADYIETAKETVRKLINENNWKQICSTRFVCDAVKMAKAGYTGMAILNTFLSDWDDNQRRTVVKAVKEATKKE